MSENLKIKLKRILCLIIGFLTFNSISAVAVEKAIATENVDNYFLTQKHILESPELYNFVKDIEKGIFPDVSQMDKKQKIELEKIIYKLCRISTFKR